MAGINKVILVGRVGGDPETRKFQNDNEMAEFSVATSETWRDKQTGDRKERTTWHRIKVMNDGLVKNVIRPYVKKGSLIGIEGELTVEEWEKDGQKRQAVKVLVGAFRGTVYLLGSKDDGERQSNDDGGGRSGGDYAERSGGGSRQDDRDLDAEIPF